MIAVLASRGHISARWVVGLALMATTCGSKTTPTTPTTTTRAVLAVSLQNVVGDRTTTGFSYKLQVQVQETGGVAATVSTVVLTFFAGTNPFGTTTNTGAQVFPTPIAANSGGTSLTISVTDDNTGHPYATSVQADVSYTDAVGSQTASGTANVPDLPAPPSTPTPPPSIDSFTVDSSRISVGQSTG